jgi:DNA processing protein
MQGEIEINSPEYPALLQQTEDPPKILFYKGDYDIGIFKKCVSVVGSRKMTRYGRDVTENIVEILVSLGITVVSGFMYGIDATSHSAAVVNNGRTIAVMPCGIDLIHPSYQKSLYEGILKEGGLVISEYESTTPPAIWTYPRRNRIIAGISEVTIVVEAGEDSGSLITSGLASKYGRKVFAVPGSIYSSVSYGTNKLISEYADPIISIDNLIQYFSDDIKKNGKKIFHRLLEEDENMIIQEIEKGPISMDDLSARIKIDIPVLSMKVSILQLDGFIKEDGGKLYVN